MSFCSHPNNTSIFWPFLTTYERGLEALEMSHFYTFHAMGCWVKRGTWIRASSLCSEKAAQSCYWTPGNLAEAEQTRLHFFCCSWSCLVLILIFVFPLLLYFSFLQSPDLQVKATRVARICSSTGVQDLAQAWTSSITSNSQHYFQHEISQ